jgi:hypothetical protein
VKLKYAATLPVPRVNEGAVENGMATLGSGEKRGW